jgi:hypothetical protein
MNRTVDGDRVVLELLPEDQWGAEAATLREGDGDEGEDEDPEAGLAPAPAEEGHGVGVGSQMRRPTGRVVRQTKLNQITLQHDSVLAVVRKLKATHSWTLKARLLPLPLSRTITQPKNISHVLNSSTNYLI